MPATEGQRQDFFGQPAIQSFELGLVVDVSQIIIDQCHIANPIRNRLLGDLDRRAGPFFGSLCSVDPGLFPAEGKAEQIPEFAKFVASQTDRAVAAELQSQMTKPGENRSPAR